MHRIGIFLLSLLTVASASGHDQQEVDQPADTNQRRVLFLTGGGYHDFHRNSMSLVQGLARIDDARPTLEIDMMWVGSSQGTHMRFRNDLDLHDPELFNRYEAIVAYCQGELGFDDAIRQRFLEYIRSGGGYVAIHSAADSHPGWDEYDSMLGGRFESHPPVGEISVQIDVADHDITRGLPTNWTLVDEFYHLKNYREDDKLVLMRGRSPGDAEDAPLRPVTWEKNYGHGRVFYTILGHGAEPHRDERFHQLIANAIHWAADAPKPDEHGVYHLFDGKTKNGWSMAGPGEFLIDNGELVAQGGMGMLWYHERRFRDFTLHVEWKTTSIDDNSGVFVRFPKPSNDPWYAVRHGHEIQILDDPNAGPNRGSGSVYAHADAKSGASNPPGEWNTFEITVRGDEYTVVLNGQKVCQWTSPSERHGREGYIGLQNHSFPVRFRNITVTELD